MSDGKSTGHPKSGIEPIILMQVLFEQIGIDLIVPLEQTTHGHYFALVLMYHATLYPEAVALRNISAKSVAYVLFRIISQVGIPKDSLTD